MAKMVNRRPALVPVLSSSATNFLKDCQSSNTGVTIATLSDATAALSSVATIERLPSIPFIVESQAPRFVNLQSTHICSPERDAAPIRGACNGRKP
jgi:hypothetical protein